MKVTKVDKICDAEVPHVFTNTLYMLLNTSRIYFTMQANRHSCDVLN
jgi:hypothetical protein